MAPANSPETVNDLNDDCMLHIFSFLPLNDLVRIERVCKNWQRISLMSPRKVGILKTEELRLLLPILNKYGDSLTSLTIGVGPSDYLYYRPDFGTINKYCGKLHHLNIFVSKFSIGNLNVERHPFLKSLKTLQLYAYDQDFDEEKLFESFFNILENNHYFTNIEIYGDLHRSAQIGPIYRIIKSKGLVLRFHKFYRNKNLNTEKLFQLFSKYAEYQKENYLDVRLAYVASFQFPDLIPILDKVHQVSLKGFFHDFFEGDDYATFQFPKLWRLKLYCNINITDNSILKMVKCCPFLEVLQVRQCEKVTEKGIRHIGNLKNLISLTIQGGDSTSNTIEYIVGKCAKLEELFCYFKAHFSPSQIESIITLLPNLKQLEVNGAKNCTKEDLRSISELVILRKKGLHIHFLDWLDDESDLELLGLKLSSSSEPNTNELGLSISLHLLSTRDFYRKLCYLDVD